MCGCEAHHDRTARCTCVCLSHQRKRERQDKKTAPEGTQVHLSTLPRVQYWVTERTIGLEPPNEQMRFLNELETEADLKYEFLSCDPHGHYIFRVTHSEDVSAQCG